MKNTLSFSNFIAEASGDPLDKNKDAIDAVRDKIKEMTKKISDIEDIKKRQFMSLNLIVLNDKLDMLQSQKTMLRFKSKMN